MNLGPALLLATCCGALAAQTVTTTLEALTPIPCSVTVGGQATTSTLPSGPIPWYGQVSTLNNVGANLEQSLMRWFGVSTISEAYCELQFTSALTNGQLARVGPGELLATFAATGTNPLPVRMQGELTTNGGAGLNVQLDIGNDGTIDWPHPTQQGMTFTLPDITAQPLQVRVIFDFHSAQPGNSFGRLELNVVRDDIYINRIPTNCGTAPFAVRSLFDPSQAAIVSDSASSTWHVFGLQSQAALLPASLTNTLTPCLVLPTLDYVVHTGAAFVPIPPAVRPITLYAQQIDVWPFLRVSSTYQVIAL